MKSEIALVCVAALVAPTLTACIPTPDVAEASTNTAEPAACDSKTVQSHVGKRFTAVLAEQMRKEAGASLLRTGPKDGPVTMDYRVERLNVFYDEAMLIAIVNCG
jgi:Peptidase inhibitor I78 family